MVIVDYEENKHVKFESRRKRFDVSKRYGGYQGKTVCRQSVPQSSTLIKVSGRSAGCAGQFYVTEVDAYRGGLDASSTRIVKSMEPTALRREARFEIPQYLGSMSAKLKSSKIRLSSDAVMVKKTVYDVAASGLVIEPVSKVPAPRSTPLFFAPNIGQNPVKAFDVLNELPVGLTPFTASMKVSAPTSAKWCRTEYAKVHRNVPHFCWAPCPSRDPFKQFVEVDLGSMVDVAAISTMGRFPATFEWESEVNPGVQWTILDETDEDIHSWVTKYELLVRAEGRKDWVSLGEFAGPSDMTTEALQTISHLAPRGEAGVHCRHLRFRPIEYHGAHAAMRIGVYGPPKPQSQKFRDCDDIEEPHIVQYEIQQKLAGRARSMRIRRSGGNVSSPKTNRANVAAELVKLNPVDLQHAFEDARNGANYVPTPQLQSDRIQGFPEEFDLAAEPVESWEEDVDILCNCSTDADYAEFLAEERELAEEFARYFGPESEEEEVKEEKMALFVNESLDAVRWSEDMELFVNAIHDDCVDSEMARFAELFPHVPEDRPIWFDEMSVIVNGPNGTEGKATWCEMVDFVDGVPAGSDMYWTEEMSLFVNGSCVEFEADMELTAWHAEMELFVNAMHKHHTAPKRAMNRMARFASLFPYTPVERLVWYDEMALFINGDVEHDHPPMWCEEMEMYINYLTERTAVAEEVHLRWCEEMEMQINELTAQAEIAEAERQVVWSDYMELDLNALVEQHEQRLAAQVVWFDEMEVYINAITERKEFAEQHCLWNDEMEIFINEITKRKESAKLDAAVTWNPEMEVYVNALVRRREQAAAAALADRVVWCEEMEVQINAFTRQQEELQPMPLTWSSDMEIFNLPAVDPVTWSPDMDIFNMPIATSQTVFERAALVEPESMSACGDSLSSSDLDSEDLDEEAEDEEGFRTCDWSPTLFSPGGVDHWPASAAPEDADLADITFVGHDAGGELETSDGFLLL